MKPTLRTRPIKYVVFDVFSPPSGFTSTAERWHTSKANAEADARRVLKARAVKGMAADTLLTITAV